MKGLLYESSTLRFNLNALFYAFAMARKWHDWPARHVSLMTLAFQNGKKHQGTPA